jgi:hypothetical protein
LFIDHTGIDITAFSISRRVVHYAIKARIRAGPSICYKLCTAVSNTEDIKINTIRPEYLSSVTAI